MTARIIVGDALSALRDLPDESVHCCISSPPYWGLRSYGGDPGMIGLEPTFDEHLENLVEVFREVRRVLRKDGVLWLNYGDAYAAGGNGGHRKSTTFHGHSPDREKPPGVKKAPPGYKPKDLLLMPTDVAAALRDDGWYLRSMIPQIKTNPMPESTKDRPTNAVEYWFLLAKSPRYFYDQEAVKEPVSGTANPRVAKDYKMPDGWNTGPGAHGKIHPKGREKGKARQRAVPPSHAGREAASHQSLENPEYDHRMRPPGVTPKSAPAGSGIKSNESYQAAMVEQPATRNMRNWVMAATAPFKGAHFATFAPHIIEPWIKAGTSEKGCCSECGAPWARETGEKEPASGRGSGNKERKYREDYGGNPDRKAHQGHAIPWSPSTTPTTGWAPSCDCDAGDPVPCTVLDPFAGSGTVGLVADRLQRDSILIEINPEYAEMARNRIHDDAPLLSEAAE